MSEQSDADHSYGFGYMLVQDEFFNFLCMLFEGLVEWCHNFHSAVVSNVFLLW